MFARSRICAVRRQPAALGMSASRLRRGLDRRSTRTYRSRQRQALVMQLRHFRPRRQLVTKSTQVDYPKFPVIDAHNHLGEDFGGGWIDRSLSEMHDALDAVGVT